MLIQPPAMEPQRQSHIIKQKTGPDDPELQATLQEALAQVSPGDVVAIADELATRRERLFLRTWARQAEGWNADEATLGLSFGEVSAAVTHTRANAKFLQGYFGPHNLGLLHKLLTDADEVPVRVAAFVDQLTALDTRLALELAPGLLANLEPNENWLWTRWLWDPTTGTGILPLLAGSVHNLAANGIAEGYARVGAVTAMSMKFAEGTGLWTQELTDDKKRAAFANSAFLACAYSIYMYGSTGWRLSREFNDLLPSLPNMARRLLGLPKVKDAVSADPDGGEGS
jgi:hypothetical protein